MVVSIGEPPRLPDIIHFSYGVFHEINQRAMGVPHGYDIIAIPELRGGATEFMEPCAQPPLPEI